MKKTILSSIILFVAIATAVVSTFAWLTGISVTTYDRPIILDPSSNSDLDINYNLYKGIDFDYNGTLDRVIDENNAEVDEDTLSVDEYLNSAYSELIKGAVLDENTFDSLLPSNVVSFALKIENNEDQDLKLDLHFTGLEGDPTLLIMNLLNVNIRQYSSSLTPLTAKYKNSSTYPEQYEIVDNKLSSTHNFEFLKNGELFLHNATVKKNSFVIVTYQVRILNLSGMQSVLDNYFSYYFNSYYENYLLDYISTTPSLYLAESSLYTISSISTNYYLITDTSTDKDINTIDSLVFYDTDGNMLVKDSDYVISSNNDYTYNFYLKGTNHFANLFSTAITSSTADLSSYKANINSVVLDYIDKFDQNTSSYNLSEYDRGILENIIGIDINSIAATVSELEEKKNITSINADDSTVSIAGLVMVINDYKESN